jgi:phage terminase large subunit-like protein
MTTTTPFKRTPKQKEATIMLASSQEAALFGGSRSGKTFIIIRSILIRAAKTKSRHLIARFRFNHVKTSIWYDTLPKVLSICFPGLQVSYNKTDWFITLANGSEIWFGGVDDKERVEKILGNEYSTIYLNESSQIGYDAVTMLQTRLAENSGLKLRMWYDFNPPTKKHWTYLYFVEGRNPDDLKPLINPIPFLVMNPVDNTDNLPPGYMEILDRLPQKQRDRFMSGKFTLDVDGALWDYEMIIAAQLKTFTEHPERTVLAVDPAVTNNENSDETGIVVASRFGNDYNVDADYTIKASTQTWAVRVINAYNEHQADAIIVETNQGGDLVENVLRLNGFKGRLIKIHAKKGKALRAEPIVALYEQGLVSHSEGVGDLESEMMEWVPFNTKDSPNRIDAAVYALTELSGGDDFGEMLEMALLANA